MFAQCTKHHKCICIWCPFILIPEPVYSCVFIAQFSVVWNSLSDGFIDEMYATTKSKKKKKRWISKPKLKPHKLHCWYSCLSSAACRSRFLPPVCNYWIKTWWFSFSLFRSLFQFLFVVFIHFSFKFLSLMRRSPNSDSIINFLFYVCFSWIRRPFLPSFSPTYCFVSFYYNMPNAE